MLKENPFFAALNTENQIEAGKQYTDLSSRSDFSKFFIRNKFMIMLRLEVIAMLLYINCP